MAAHSSGDVSEQHVEACGVDHSEEVFDVALPPVHEPPHRLVVFADILKEMILEFNRG
jgi:hypothetical protein